MYALEFDEGWEEYFGKLPSEIKVRILKKIEQIKQGLPGRHLHHGVPIFVEEVGQYRICYSQDEKRKTRKIYFAGDHKDYEKWIRKIGRAGIMG
ncbi:MAG: hypothetical protein AB1657_01455 [Candidatus Micrarchaeota archaeon]